MKDYPVIKLAVLFVLGILSAEFFNVGIITVSILFTLTLIVLFLSRGGETSGNYKYIFIISAAILIIFVGNLLASKSKIGFNQDLSEINKVKNTTVIGDINKIDLLKNDELIFYLSVDSMYSDEFKANGHFNILCKIKVSKSLLLKFYDLLSPGNKLKVTGYYHRGKERRNPGEFDYDAYLRSKQILGMINIDGSSAITILNHQTDYFKNTIFQIRKSIDNRIKEYYSAETAGLLRGLLLADRGEISYETKTEFINAGVVHVLAVSGLHVGYIILIFLFLFGRLNIYLRSVLTILGLIFFMFITGVPPSVFRATVMAIILIVAYLSNRSTNLINSISIGAIIILLINPNELFNPGFQLSFAAVLAIGIILPYMNRLIESWHIQNKFVKYIILFCAVSLSAQIGTLPFTLLYFNKFSVIALFTNPIVIPAIGIIIASAIVTLIVSIVLPPVAIYFASFTDIFSKWILSIIGFSGNLSYSYLSINNYSVIDLVIFYAMLSALLILLPKFYTLKSKVILIVLIAANTFIYSRVDDKDLLPDNLLSVFMLDVDQGDSFLIKFPDGQTALVDAGNATSFFDNGERVIIPLMEYLGISKIDFGIVSHIDSDHYGGFVSLVLSGKVKKIIKPKIDTSLSKDVKFESFLKLRKVPIEYYKNEKLEVGGAVLYFLNCEEFNNFNNKSTNNNSAVLKLVYGRTSFLFTGDVEKEGEAYYSTKYKNFLDSDVLKVSHHGSKTSSTELFLNYVTPQLSLISAGFKNKFGHPTGEILNRLKNTGSTIYRTDLEKAILLQSNGNQITLIKW